jgi:ADP-ribose pyrophosphatase YjhB (NUDIX family)
VDSGFEVEAQMPGIRTAARALILRDEALLVTCYQDAEGEWFALPGGGQRHGEELRATIARECLEETGYQVHVGRLRFVRELIAARYPLPHSPPDFHQVEHIFQCEVTEEHAAAATKPDTLQSDCRWVPVTELRRARFYPRTLLDHLRNSEVVYLGDAE